jgi:hypothetical protein
MHNVVQEVEAAHFHIHIESLGSNRIRAEQGFYVVSFFNFVRNKVLDDGRRPNNQRESVTHSTKAASVQGVLVSSFVNTDNHIRHPVSMLLRGGLFQDLHATPRVRQ